MHVVLGGVWCMRVSYCKSCVLVSLVHSVAMRSAVFCMVCSLFVFVSDIMGDYIVFPYYSAVLVIVVYVFSNASFDLPQWEVVSSFIIFSGALSVVFCTWFENVCLGSNVNLNIFMPLFVGSVVLFIVIFV